VNTPEALVALHATVRVRTPPQEVEHADHAPASNAYTTHGEVLQAREVAGAAEVPTLPAHNASATTLPLLARQVRVRVDTPPPHCLSQADQDDVGTRVYTGAGGHAGAEQVVDTSGVSSVQRDRGKLAPDTEPTQVAVRVRVPLVPHAVASHGPYSEYVMLYVSQATVPQGSLVAGGVGRLAHRDVATVAPVESRHVTDRVRTPPPHVTLQGPKAPTA
jgi:hypothetical protein